MSSTKTEQIILKHLLQIRNEVRELKLANKEVLTMDEAVVYSGYCDSSLYRAVKKGELPYGRPNGKATFLRRKQLEDWLMTKGRSTMSKNEEKARKLLKRSK